MSHRYGPHDPSTAPEHITVLRGRRPAVEALVPVPEALRRQRANINRRAREASL